MKSHSRGPNDSPNATVERLFFFFGRISSEYYGTSGCRKSEVMEPQKLIHIPFTVTTYRVHVTVMVIFVNVYGLGVTANVRYLAVVASMGLRATRLSVF